MKDYYIFPTSGEPIGITQDGEQFKISIKEIVNPEWVVSNDMINIKFNQFSPRFTKDSLIQQLEEFIRYLKKYG